MILSGMDGATRLMNGVVWLEYCLDHISLILWNPPLIYTKILYCLPFIFIFIFFRIRFEELYEPHSSPVIIVLSNNRDRKLIRFYVIIYSWNNNKLATKIMFLILWHYLLDLLRCETVKCCGCEQTWDFRSCF